MLVPSNILRYENTWLDSFKQNNTTIYYDEMKKKKYFHNNALMN